MPHFWKSHVTAQLYISSTGRLAAEENRRKQLEKAEAREPVSAICVIQSFP